MPSAEVAGTRIEYETRGDPNHPAVLLIAGLGEQLTTWHPELCAELEARGFFVVRFDNRDAGLSQKSEDAGIPDILTAMVSGRAPNPPYTLDDLAADAVGVLDALDIEAAHVAGGSMGGMIAQTLAINHRERALSLTSIMSTTGNGALPRGTSEAYQVLLAPPPPADQLDRLVEHSLRIWNTFAGPGYPTPDAVRTAWIRRDLARCHYPPGVARQLYAIIAGGDRRSRLQQLDLPTVVLHGSADPLIPVEAGEDTAANIPNAELRIVEGWGHDFPLALVDTFADAISDAARRAEQR